MATRKKYTAPKGMSPSTNPNLRATSLPEVGKIIGATTGKKGSSAGVVPGGTNASTAAGAANLQAGTRKGGRERLTRKQKKIVSRGVRAVKRHEVEGPTHRFVAKDLRAGIRKKGMSLKEKTSVKMARRAIRIDKGRRAAKKWTRRYKRAQG